MRIVCCARMLILHRLPSVKQLPETLHYEAPGVINSKSPEKSVPTGYLSLGQGSITFRQGPQFQIPFRIYDVKPAERISMPDNSSKSFKIWWGKDLYRSTLLVGGFLFAVFILQGLPYWDDDFASVLTPNQSRSLFHLFLQWLSPIFTGSMNYGMADRWGFQDRPVQFIAYKISYLIAGYDPWPYSLFKCACFAGLGVMIYSWALRLQKEGQDNRKAAFAASVFFLVTPGPVASMVWLTDFAPAAELAFLVLTFILWKKIEETPVEWVSLRPLADSGKRKWLWTWIGLSFAVYLGYKTKADLKLIPAILAAYIFLVRRRQWRLFGIPIGLMMVLSVPWHRGIFTERPPFLPGSRPSNVGFMWQPARFSALREFLWSPDRYDFMGSLRGNTISLAGLFGPFLLGALLVFVLWRARAFSGANWKVLETPRARAVLFQLLWFGAILAGMSSLADLNNFFRVRYGILMLVPATILLAWLLGLFNESLTLLPRWAAAGFVALFLVQAGVNSSASMWHRRELGRVMTAMDQGYSYVDEVFPNGELALWPGLRSYDYRPDASKAVRDRDPLARPEDLIRRHTPGKTLALSWEPSHLEQLDYISYFSGCRPTTLFDRIFPCEPGSGLYLMGYIGPDGAFQAAEAARAKGNMAEARRDYETILDRHPTNLGAQFNLGIVLLEQKNWAEAESVFARMEGYFPADSMVLYNRALAMIELKQIEPAEDRLKRVVKMQPLDYGARFNLARIYTMEGTPQLAEATMREWNQLPKPAPAPIDPVATAEEQARRVPTPENYLNLSLQYYQKQRYQDSIAAAREALKLKPDYAEADNNIAAAFNGLGMWDDAISAGKEALRIKPDFQLAKNNLETSLSQKKKALEGLETTEAEIRRNPTAEKYLTLSLQYNVLKQYQRSILACKEALKLKPDYAEAYNNIAAAYEGMENWDAAVEAARQAIRLKPGFQLAQNNLQYSLSRRKANLSATIH
jgi:tetratricopeptide (TPR) repeat protein